LHAKDEVTPTELRNVHALCFYRQVIPTGLEETYSFEIDQACVTEL